MKKLNFCSGHKPRDGWINIDIQKHTYKDFVQHDLSVFPYPFKDNTFSIVYAGACLEHFDNLEGIFMELHRICKHGAMIHLCHPWWLHPDSRNMNHINQGGFTKDFFLSILDPKGKERYDPYRKCINKFELHSYSFVHGFPFSDYIIDKLSNWIPCLVTAIHHFIIVKKKSIDDYGLWYYWKLKRDCLNDFRRYHK